MVRIDKTQGGQGAQPIRPDVKELKTKASTLAETYFTHVEKGTRPSLKDRDTSMGAADPVTDPKAEAVYRDTPKAKNVRR